jgi:hypothetical protein
VSADACGASGWQEKDTVICRDERCLNFATLTECVRCSKMCGNQRIRWVWCVCVLCGGAGKPWAGSVGAWLPRMLASVAAVVMMNYDQPSP